MSFDTEAARARKIQSSQDQFSRYKQSQAPPPLPASPGPGAGSLRPSRTPLYLPDRATIVSRPVRVETVFHTYYTRPVTIYQDPYSHFFWYWLLDRSLDDRALWAYHHRSSMDAARYQALLEHDYELESRVAQLEAQRVPVNPDFVPGGLDRDLMFSDAYVQRAYQNRPTPAGRVAFWLVAAPALAGCAWLLAWLLFFKRWSPATQPLASS